MRITITFRVEKIATFSFDHRHLLHGVVYSYLNTASRENAKFLHNDGYPQHDARKWMMKLFGFSGLRFQCKIKQPGKGLFSYGPGDSSWVIGSPQSLL